MIIVKVTGGIGNQMFQYALYRALLNKGKNVKLDIRDFSIHKYWNGYQLSDVFNIYERLASEQECLLLQKIDMSKCSDWEKSNLICETNTYICEWNLYKNSFFRYQQFYEEIFNVDNVYLEGFWQSWRYFEDIKSILFDDFTIKKELDDINLQYKKIICKSMSVSLHVRRSDFIGTALETVEIGYYYKAIEYFEKKYDNVYFFVFSDDIAWCKKHIKAKNILYVTGNEGKRNVYDMYLMSMCKNNIIANSSFSWWGAYLNRNRNKEVIYPRQWNTQIHVTDNSYIYPDWIGL